MKESSPVAEIERGGHADNPASAWIFRLAVIAPAAADLGAVEAPLRSEAIRVAFRALHHSDQFRFADLTPRYSRLFRPVTDFVHVHGSFLSRALFRVRGRSGRLPAYRSNQSYFPPLSTVNFTGCERNRLQSRWHMVSFYLTDFCVRVVLRLISYIYAVST